MDLFFRGFKTNLLLTLVITNLGYTLSKLK